mmetsp:Transcript_24225/g.56405  ORF Transcript_24225/g.56405 Transcript_24225/m.56405 type:complete len:144 (-) Transcript_24225:10-441(-)
MWRWCALHACVRLYVACAARPHVSAPQHRHAAAARQGCRVAGRLAADVAAVSMGVVQLEYQSATTHTRRQWRAQQLQKDPEEQKQHVRQAADVAGAAAAGIPSNQPGQLVGHCARVTPRSILQTVMPEIGGGSSADQKRRAYL